MSDTSKVAKTLRAFQMAITAHDQQNPDHTAYGIGLAHFDMERLGFEEGETVLPGITIHADSGVTGNFRVLCDGTHNEDQESVEEAEVVEAVSSEPVAVPVGGERWPRGPGSLAGVRPEGETRAPAS